MAMLLRCCCDAAATLRRCCDVAAIYIQRERGREREREREQERERESRFIELAHGWNSSMRLSACEKGLFWELNPGPLAL